MTKNIMLMFLSDVKVFKGVVVQRITKILATQRLQMNQSSVIFQKLMQRSRAKFFIFHQTKSKI